MKSDNQVTGMAGEFLTVGKLFKKRLQVAVTFGNAKAIDIFAFNHKTKKNYNVQVKTSRNKENFFLQENKIEPDHIFVFIILNGFENSEDYFIIKGSEILQNLNKFFGSTYKSEKPKMSAVRWRSLKDYKDNWNEFDK